MSDSPLTYRRVLLKLSGEALMGDSQYGIDPDRILIAGGSAGGGLTAVLAMMARDRRGPALLGQMLIYPMLDDRNDSASAMQIFMPRSAKRSAAARPMPLAPSSPAGLPADARAAVLAWFDARGRALAFRATRDPYAILVSEVMAQQTQISRVVDAWARFLDRFPTVAALAAATPAEVVRAWRGMGYDRRALNLQRAAKVMVAEHDGEVPRDIDALDNRAPDALQAQMLIDFNRLLERATLRFLRRHGEEEATERLVARFHSAADQLGPQLPGLLTTADAAALKARQEDLTQAGIPDELARRVASAEPIVAVLDIAEVAAATGRSLELVASVYFALDLQLHYGWMRERVTALPADTHWQTLARVALQSDLTALQRALTSAVIQLSPALDTPQGMIEAWQTRNRNALERYRRLLADLQSASSFDLAMLSVAAREMRTIETT